MAKCFLMDLQTRKLAFIQDFLQLQNEEAVTRLEKLLKKESKSPINEKWEPMTIQELDERIAKSLDDARQDKLISNKDLMAKIETWH